ncbi:MAG TPA: branched-chain amino acid transaminase [Cyclobacteriaceae bacterium]|nr:branched-chain amino acid transaminase [Cyclobacteriaceae bacterium]HMV07268.1 branched-chain amino acid transaminase [Cyclobacteriaceae bacterium]HMV88583.1 branched-chain amino acid transaminase [Cyclobacteriaceae bacterium]HMW99377.1 branched-chain amino acid transaminase [Cyclobacteriaceae bacterium]HMX48834.1 branched-chain amino acid transaminase [Cyclobacteriaceae bacterium]
MYYNANTILFLNGKYIKATDATTDLYSQTLHYGYGVFEGIRSYETSNGAKIFKAVEHFERLKKSCELVNIPFNYDTDELIQISYNVLKKNNMGDAYIRPLVYCSPNMQLQAPKEVYLMICAWEWGKYLGDSLLNLCISSYQRPNPNSVKVEAKVTGHYINSILATSEAKVRGFDEALMLDMNGNIAEGPGANFFCEKDGVLYTPPLGHILPGITRETVINICRELEIPLVEKYFTPEELEGIDSAFMCGTAAEIIGINTIDARPMKKKWKESLGATIQEVYKNIVLEKSYADIII